MPRLAEIQRVGLSILRNVGVPADHAQTQLNVLLDAELRGVQSHGLLRLPRVVQRVRSGACDPQTKGQGRWQAPAVYDMDGHHGMGPVVAHQALKHAMARAGDTGIALATVHNCDHLGMLAWYARYVAQQGQILIALTVSEALVHPWGGREAILGTNPVAIGIPAQDKPYVFDMATSLVSMGKIHEYAASETAIPPGWALDADGEPTTDPAQAKHGAIAPFGGAKGYGLALSFELLVLALTGCAVGTDVVGTLDDVQACNKGDVFIVLQPKTGTQAVISRFLDLLRSSAPSDPHHPVRVPGDRSDQARADRYHSDLTLPDGVWDTLLKMYKETSDAV